MQCPKCMEYSACEIMPRPGRASVVAVLLCGIILPLLWAGSRATGYKCRRCDHIAYRRTGVARVCLVLLVIAVALILMTPYLLNELYH